MPTDSSLVFPTGSADDSAMVSDYAALRKEGLRQLERLAGSEWTDFNPHDPGITILEQFCYALTELAYRCDFSLPDLLSREGKDPYASLHGAARMLSSRPVTLVDLRKLAIDVPGVKNAWLEKAGQPAAPVFYDREGASLPLDRQESLIQLAGGEGADAVNLKGLYRVLIETVEADGAAVASNVASRLHAHRPLCMDFESVRALELQKIRVRASIEIGPAGSPDDIYVAILGKLAAHLSPSIPFYTLAQRRAAGLRIDEIFDGPPLAQGFIDTGELLGRERKTALRASDFIHAIMDVEGVLMVKHLALALGEGGRWEDWWLDLKEGTTPVLDIESSAISLERRQITVRVDTAGANLRHQQAQASLAYRPARPEDLDIVPPSGRDRRVGRYYSAQHQFPEVYGLGERGLPPQAGAQRRAQLRQLQAYLLFFDQLLANQFAQLAHVGDLLGFEEDNPQTYFAGDLDDPGLGLDAVWQKQDAQARRDRLARIVENPAAAAGESAPQIDWARKNRFLDHLLARFAEQFTDHAQFRQDVAATAGARQESLARDKQAWLRRYPRLSADRGAGFNALMPWNEEADPDLDNCSGLEQRLRLKLGLRSAARDERFYLVEHVLLRPIDADKGQQPLPLLADARGADPYSLQISLVFPGWPGRFQEGGGFRRFVEQTLREEAPAHLLVRVLWLDEAGMAKFEAAYQAWLDSQRLLREGNGQKVLSPPLGDGNIRLRFRLRDARDRLLDLLAIGRTYPLADLPVSYATTVAWGQPGRITLGAGQLGVFYHLLGKDGRPLLGEDGKPLYRLLDKDGKNPLLDGDGKLLCQSLSKDGRPLLGEDGKLLYQLLDKDGKPLPGKDGKPLAVIAYGDGGDLVLATPPITKDISFTVRATKPHSSLFAAALGSDRKIRIEDSRPDTRYELCDKDGKSFAPKVEKPGNGGELALEPPSGAADDRFTVRAVKPLAVTLFEAIDIRVGLDTSLHAEIVDAELLDPAAAAPAAPPRIVDYGAAPHVKVRAVQAGVDYHLVRVQDDPAGADYVIADPDSAIEKPIALRVISPPAAPDDSHDATLQTHAMEEDTDIRVLAIKTFDASENQETQYALLDAVLPLKVRANPALVFTVSPPLLDYREAAAAVVTGSQTTASYRVLARPISDSEFIRPMRGGGFVQGGGEIVQGKDPSLGIDGMASLWVMNPPNPTVDATTEGEAKPGNGADLRLAIDGLEEDSLVVVRATKRHKLQDGAFKESSLQLTQAAAILVRPAPGPDADLPLRLQAKDGGAPAAGGLKQGAVYHVRNGQPGVFYHFRLEGGGEDLGLPVYVHKAGKGVGQLQVEIDFTATLSLPTPPPEWDCPVDLDAGALLSIRAVKAQTGLETVFTRSVGALLATD